MTGASHPANKRQAGRVRHALTSADMCCGLHAAIIVAGDVSIYKAATRCILVGSCSPGGLFAHQRQDWWNLFVQAGRLQALQADKQGCHLHGLKFLLQPHSFTQQQLLALDELSSSRLGTSDQIGVLQPKHISPTTSNASGQYLWYRSPSWSVSCAAELIRYD